MRNEATLSLITQRLQENCGDRLGACKATGVSLIFLNQWCKDDPQVEERVLEAERVGNQGLVSEAIRRAVTGYEKGIYYKGMLTATETQYSDGLLQALLKAKIDDFKAQDQTLPSVQVNIANIMPRANTYEEWLAMRDKTLALEAPDNTNVIDMKEVRGEYVCLGEEEDASENGEKESDPFKGIVL